MSEIPQKPHDATWTDEQWEAIVRRGDNLLVSAAAGSGKTAVLVERIIRLVSDPEQPVDIDRLLVATFTKAAAAEMKQRVRSALEQALDDRPESEHLRRQLSLIHRASITTLHSFCLEVVRRHARLIGLDPSFRVASETEAELLRQDALEETFESFYADSPVDSPFWQLVDAYGGPKSDEALFRLVLGVYDFSRSHPWPDVWLEEQASAFEAAAGADHEEGAGRKWTEWVDSLLTDVEIRLQGARDILNAAHRIACEPGGPEPYAEMLDAERSGVEAACEQAKMKQWNALYDTFQTFSFGRLKACRGDEYDADLREKARQLRDEAKEVWAHIRESLFMRTLEQYADELVQMAPVVHALHTLVKQFAERYRQMKLAKAVVDFSDLEHYCLQVLLAEDAQPDCLKPSPHALEYQRQFDEVLVDEYQDTNLVQETILMLLSTADPGNRFMVGDVKQSIYRFRLAEPSLFLDKYRTYANDGSSGHRIDLSRNFRSRAEVVDGVNFLFRQLMNRSVAEMDYDAGAELVLGASYPPQTAEAGAIELQVLERDGGPEPDEDRSEEGVASPVDEASRTIPGADDLAEVETARLEARWIAARIRALTGKDGSSPLMVRDETHGGRRAVEYRDIVILLRATRSWGEVITEELAHAGIPCYAELDSGYFSAGEIEMMVSLLQVIDNPYQDIPLAAVLRSPIVQLSAEEMGRIRLADKHGAYYEAVKRYARLDAGANPRLQNRLSAFLGKLDKWRQTALQQSVSELIQQIYRDTGLIEIAGGLPGGTIRQANLKALYDRARQYEETTFRGLFRFLRFIERMRDNDKDLGSARAIGEQENVVRLMSIHKSKGLEFPVVIAAGMGKMFNRQDLNRPFLLHRELGFGPKRVDDELRLSYPTLPHLAIQRKWRMEMLAEEFRVLYVAMTRAKEKLIFVGTVRQLDRLASKWAVALDEDGPVLPAHILARANTYLDWIASALIRHPAAAPLRERAGIAATEVPERFRSEPSRWNVSLAVPDTMLQLEAAAALERPDSQQLQAVRVADPLPEYVPGPDYEEVKRRLEWTYDYESDTRMFSKTSVSEWKRLSELDDEIAAYSLLPAPLERRKPSLRRPKFLTEMKLTPAETGTAYHLVMQHMPLDREWSAEQVAAELDRLTSGGILTEVQRQAMDPAAIAGFFVSEPGRALLRAKHVWREAPFSYGVSAEDIYPHEPTDSNAIVLVQGVIDCLFESEDGGLILIDYKTDAVYNGRLYRIRDNYSLQIGLYARAVADIWKRPVTRACLYLFDGGHVLDMPTDLPERQAP